MDDRKNPYRDGPCRDDSQHRSNLDTPRGAVHTQLGGVAGLARENATMMGCPSMRAHMMTHAEMGQNACMREDGMYQHGSEAGLMPPTTIQRVLPEGVWSPGPEPASQIEARVVHANHMRHHQYSQAQSRDVPRGLRWESVQFMNGTILTPPLESTQAVLAKSRLQ